MDRPLVEIFRDANEQRRHRRYLLLPGLLIHQQT
jgi:hypothetical protein